jgi:uncharacterized membrane protein YdbT with pleckstrin-like domain
MGFPRRLLNDDETVVVDLHPHWWFLAGPVIALVGATVLAVVALVVTGAGTTPRLIGGWASLALIVVSACWLVVRWLHWVTINFAITTQRVVRRSGVIAKSGMEIPLERVNTVMSSQGMFERLVGVGDLVIESGGDFGQQRFTGIRRPERVTRVLHGLVHERQERAAHAGAQLDVAAQLERFEAMLHRGTLTQDEFDAQKQRLLDRL